MDDLVKKIQGMSLTRTDAEIAEYILANLNTIGFQTSTSLAEAIGVSDTSVIRFIRKLGFKGYADFRGEMNARAARQINQVQQDLSPGEKYARSRAQLKQDSLISDVGGYTLENLQKSFAQLDQGTVDQVADILLSSDRKYIVGFRGTACCAQYMASKADVVVVAQVEGLGFANSYVAPLSLSEVFLLAISGQRDVTRTERFNRIDAVMEKEKLY